MEVHPAVEIPAQVYYIAGALLLTNIGTIVSMIYAGLKSAWWLSKLDSRVHDAKNAAVRAHKRIDDLESKK